MKTKKIIFIIITVIFSISVSLSVSEAIFHLLMGDPDIPEFTQNLYDNFIDIYAEPFKKDKNAYKSFQKAIRPQIFKATKNDDVKIAFIIGESVAELYEGRKLKDSLNASFNSYKWNIINIGVGGYDSYRTLLSLKKSFKYSPDIIIAMLGNNPFHSPMKINYWPYKFPILKKSWVCVLVTEYLNPRITISFNEENKYFRKYMKEIAKECRKHKVPLVLCTLPQNQYITGMGEDAFIKPEVFSLYWRLWHDPDKITDRYQDSLPCKGDDIYFSAYAYKLMGDRAKALECYRKNIYFPAKVKREIIRDIAKENDSVILADFSQYVMEISSGQPGFEFFKDEVHYWPDIYEPISEVIVKALRNEKLKNNQILAHLPEPSATFQNTWQASSRFNRHNEVYIDALNSFFASGVKANNYNPQYTEIFRNIYYHIGREEAEEALTRFDKGDAAIITKSRINTLYGKFLWENIEYSKALKYFNKAIKYDPGNDTAYFFRALSYYDMGKREAAENDIMKLKDMQSKASWITLEYLDGLSSNAQEKK